ncbi:uncharacterized protein LOC113230000 [Hyposmocoma kahamanoa]|uniref:uncharacterized protein LOC113230000 n=1 Tax=Hyposmocoma kahamanoa TaxID=1477025 RepID=UPI000E6D7A68|nr:uncharacterized protein LOC113230000 [Hyposmocoma kahamanoa]
MEIGTVFSVLLVCGAFSCGTSLKHRKDNARILNANEVMDISDFSVYYDLKTNETIKRMMPRPWYKPGWMLRLPFMGGACSCEENQCKCCTGIKIRTFGFEKTCILLNYDPEPSTLNMEVMMNNASIYKNTFSARNPPPFCLPIPVPYVPPGLVDMCIRLFDINVMDQRLHICMDIDTRIDMTPVLVLHFDCMDMGFNGVGLSKPGGVMPASDSTEPSQLDSDVYDPVTEAVEPTTQMFNNSITYI